MSPWIKLDTAFLRNPKTAELKPPEVIALLKLWSWAGESESPHAREGYVSDAIVKTVGVSTRDARRLEAVGYLTRNGNGWHLHDWEEWQGSLIDRRARDRERKRKERHDPE